MIMKPVIFNFKSATIDLCRQLQACGVTFLTLHGRTAAQKSSEPVRVNAITEVKQSLLIPLIANGDVRTLAEADAMYEATKCNGMMSARGILANPALFAGYDKTPPACIQDWINISAKSGPNLIFQCFHHHLTFMTDSLLKKKSRIRFNNMTRKEEIFGFIDETFKIVPEVGYFEKENVGSALSYSYDESRFRGRLHKEMFTDSNEIIETYSSSKMDGKYFKSVVAASKGDETAICDLDFMDSSLFDA
jgi:tRNA-dihydrouridine synthase 4